jgi:hypothetical protein
MNKRYLTTAIVGAVFVVLVAWVLLAERGRVTEKGEYFALQLTDISQIQVQAKDYQYTMVRRGDEWWMTQPFEGLIAADEAKRVVESIASLKPQKRTGKNLQDPEFGLDSPSVTLTVTYKGNRSAVIRLGKQSPIGQMIFATISTEPTALFLIDQAFMSSVDKSPDSMRDKKLAAKVKTEDVKQVTLQRAGETVTAALVPLAQETTWRITQPRALKADKSAVESVITAVNGAEAVDFLPYTQENLATTGLDHPQVTATFTLQGAEPVTVYLGKEDKRSVKTSPTAAATDQDVVYATRSGRAEILAMKSSLLTDLNKGLLDLRDKHIFADLKREQINNVRVQREEGLNFSVMKSGQEWQVTAPKTGKAKVSKVDDILFAVVDLQALAYPVEDQANVDLEKYGLKLPQAALTLGVQGRGEPVSIWIGAKVPNEAERYYARTSLSNDVYEIDGALLRDLPTTMDDLLEPAAPPASPGKPSGGAPGTSPMTPPPGAPPAP